MNKQTEQELLKIVKSNYSAIATSFAETRKKEIWPQLGSLAENVKPGESVLDVGCGSGRLFNLFKDQDINYTGTDNCAELLKLAETNFKDSENKPKLIESDILNLNQIKQVDFDHIFCIAVLHHLPGKRLRLQALKQLKNKIKPGGRIIITNWNMWENKKYRKLIIKFWLLKLLKKNKMDFGDILFDWQDPKVHTYNQRYYHAFTKKQLQALVKEAGLAINSLYKDKYNYYLIVKKDK